MTDKKNVKEYKIKTSFLKVSFFFALGLSSFSAWSYNSMCYSPSQLAALMSPNKPNLSKGEKIRKQIKALEKKTEKYKDKLDDVEGDLGYSLSKKKLKDDPYSVAGSVRSYIKNNQSGWSCAETSSGGSNRNRKFIIKESLLLKINVWELIIPSAYADKLSAHSQGDGGTENPTNRGVASQVGETGNPSSSSFDVANDLLPIEPASEQEDKIDSKSGGTPAPKRKGAFTQKGKIDSKSGGTPAPKRKGAFTQKGKTDSKSGGTPAPKRKGAFTQKGKIDSKSGGTPAPKRKGAFTQKGKTDSKSGGTPAPKRKGASTQEGKTDSKRKGTPAPKRKGASTQEGKTDSKRKGTPAPKRVIPPKKTCLAGQELIGEECRDTPKTTCKKEGKEWKDGKCQHTPEAECKNRGGKWQYSKSGVCVCPNSYVEETKDGGKVCRDKNKSEKCRDKGGIWSQEGNCRCPENYKVEAGKCMPKTDGDLCEEQEGKSFINGNCVDCPDWKKHSSFRKNGKVDSSFCNAYAQDKRTCEDALAKLGRLVSLLDQYNRKIEKLGEKLESLNDSEDTKTEAGGLCFDCLKRELRANRPTANQTIGNLANIIAGAGFGFAGYKAGQNAQSHANMLRIQQGYPASNDYYALQGATAGYPFIANGLYGMTRVNTPVGGWACTPSVSPYGHAYSQSYGHGYQMPYYR